MTGTLDSVAGLRVRTAGPPDAPPLVLVPGFAESSAMFDRLFATALARRFRLVAVDLPGFGASPRRAGCATVADHAAALGEAVAALGRPVGLVAHWLAGLIAVETVGIEIPGSAPAIRGLVSIEGNLTAQDAYFSGRAAEHDDPQEFRSAFLADVDAMAATDPQLRAFHGWAGNADATAMWELGRDARRRSVGDAPGRAYRALPVPTLYLWSEVSTPPDTVAWIRGAGIAQVCLPAAGHWPTATEPAATAAVIAEFFTPLLRQ